MIDTHAHLDFPDFNDDRDAVVAHALDAGIHTIINIATDFASCERVLKLADHYPNMYAVLGVHPHDAKTWQGDKSAQRLKQLASHHKVVAIGEIGLDYFRDHSPRDLQKKAFIEQIAVARELKLPIVIHNRDAFGDIFDVVLREDAYMVGGVFHCFSGTVVEAEKTIELGFHISVNGILTYKNATMAEVGKSVRLDRILLETDCPFLAPHPHRGKRNEPAYVSLVADRLAELRGINKSEISQQTDANAAQLFRIPVAPKAAQS
jgi:TatD DNase family protein